MMIRRLFFSCLVLLVATAPRTTAGEAALPEGWEQNSAVFRGPTGSGLHPFAQAPTTWDEKAGKGILWQVEVPLEGLGSPVVWGDKVIVAGATRQKREVYCYNLADGALAWTGKYPVNEEAPVEYTVWDDLDAVMHAAATPATNGKQVFALYANGEIAAFNLADGKFLWSKLVGDVDGNDYGLTGSLLVYKDSVIVQFDGDSNELVRYAAADGKEIYRVERDDYTWASPILVKVGEDYRIITNGSGETASWNPEDGKKLWGEALVDGDIAPSPVYAAGKIMVNMGGDGSGGIVAVDATTGKQAWLIEELPDEGPISDANSMCTDGTFLYQFYEDLLTCIEISSGKIVYSKALDGSASYASPCVIGDKLYLNCGSEMIVATAGKEFEVLATSKTKDYCDSSVAVVPGKILIRGLKQLYCVGE